MKEDSPKSKPKIEVPNGMMYIKVYAPFKTYYDDLGTSISATNDTGPFDIFTPAP